MKLWWKYYLTYTRSERRGIVVLGSLLTLVILVRIGLNYKAESWEISEEEKYYAQIWDSLRVLWTYTPTQASILEQPVELFHFNPNTLDSTSAIKLGLRQATIKSLIQWRAKGKIFYRKEDFQKLYGLSDADWKRLESYIHIPPISSSTATKPILWPVDINQADSSTLTQLKGIGPVLAKKIIAYRKSLGGYIALNQLREVYSFSDSVFQELSAKLYADSSQIQRININTAQLVDLQSHPYIDKKTAIYIVEIREKEGKFTDIEQIRLLPLMNAKKYRKIAPYLTLE